MSIESVRSYLKQFGVDDEIKEFDVSSATVALAADALGCLPAHIAKSLSFLVDGFAILVVSAGDTKIDNPKFKQEFGTKAKMLSAEQTVSMIGHAVGGVCPFGVNDGVSVYLDVSLQRFSHVYPACGSSNSAIQVTPDELYKYANPKKWVDVCKIIE